MEPRARLDTYLEDRGLAAVWFARPTSFAWLTGGDNFVDRHAPIGVAAAGYDGDRVAVVTDNIEADRLATEELSADVQLIEFPWYEGSLAQMVAATTDTPAAADFSVPGLKSIEQNLRYHPLSESSVEQYRELGSLVAKAVETVCFEATPSESERVVAARLRHKLAAHGIDTSVVLVGSDARVTDHRHYTPTETELGRYALVSVTATRDGLYASMTRTVSFAEPEWLAKRHRVASQIQSTALAATQATGRADGTASDVFSAIQSAYAEMGYPDEWERHHQGGAAGYAGRTWIATPTLDTEVKLPMAFAWNPTVQGAKSEDTWLVTEDGFECLTRTGDWETISSPAVGFDLMLSHPTILRRG
ncbi:M24 family metallopeptidase [Haladaptatus sp. CMSO5]|uniref:M24 family metallopeptidase n=1 Tax=Haladaptatus sp. CMSO5 TaxID=3120514 RepID=UPI002FCE3F89